MLGENRCPKCEASLPANAPNGICPKCLIQAGLLLDTNVLSDQKLEGTPPNSQFVPPTPLELAPKFPQLEILELLGRGGMGAVYKARQPRLDRIVAVKILPPEVGSDLAFAQRFEREAKALAKLSHQNIVSVFDFGEADGLYYFMMEFVDGANLRDAMETGMLPSEEALELVQQICDALQYAHRQGVVHRDIKPENILVDTIGRVKIADFGLAKLLDSTPNDFSLTGTQQVMGTLRYMAPEQMEGTKAVDHRADIFSLGVIFYELLTGELPVGRFDPPSKKRGLDTRLDEVVLRALEKEPERRYQQASEVNIEIESISRIPLHAPVKTPVIEPVDSNPVYSRKALIGAVWAPIFFITIPPAIFLFSSNSGPAEEAIGYSPLWYLSMFFLLILVPLGITAPFGTTILGVVATSQIRHSRGKLLGLPLALAGALIFPLLMLDAIILMSCYFPVFLLPLQENAAYPSIALIALALLFGLVLCIVVDLLIIRWAWRKSTMDPVL